MTNGTEIGGGWERHRWRIAGWSIAAIILLLPLAAMRITDEVAWTLFDLTRLEADIAARSS